MYLLHDNVESFVLHLKLRREGKLFIYVWDVILLGAELLLGSGRSEAKCVVLRSSDRNLYKCTGKAFNPSFFKILLCCCSVMKMTSGSDFPVFNLRVFFCR